MRRWLWLRFTRDGRDEREAAKRYRASQERGRKLILAMRASGELKERSPRKVVNLPPVRETCAHCQRPNRGVAVSGYATVDGKFVCHPDVGVDCYRLVTLYKHPTPCACGIWGEQ